MTDTAAQSSQRISYVQVDRQIDLASFFGVFLSFLTIGVGIFIGGSAPAFVNIPSILIVIGGTIGVTLACTTFRHAREIFASVGLVFRRNQTNIKSVARQLIEVAQIARTSGLLSLQNFYEILNSQPLLFKGVTMVVDGATENEITRVLELETNSRQERREGVINILTKAGDIAPAMGLLGTLIGLVQMLVQLDDPSSIGPAMAVALLTTFYGVILSNLVFLPASTKLENFNSYQAVIDSMYILAVQSLQRQENPRRLEMQMNTILPATDQLSMFD